MIPDALMEMSDTSLSGKLIVVIGFGGIGKEASCALRDNAGAKVVVVEHDANLAVTAKLNGFEVRSLESVLPHADLCIIIKEQVLLTTKVFMRAKNNCIFASLEVDHKSTSIDFGALCGIKDATVS